MASYGSEISFLLVFSARDDLVKVSWKSDAQKCQNQVTLLTLTSWVKVPSPFVTNDMKRIGRYSAVCNPFTYSSRETGGEIDSKYDAVRCGWRLRWGALQTVDRRQRGKTSSHVSSSRHPSQRWHQFPKVLWGDSFPFYVHRLSSLWSNLIFHFNL